MDQEPKHHTQQPPHPDLHSRDEHKKKVVAIAVIGVLVIVLLTLLSLLFFPNEKGTETTNKTTQETDLETAQLNNQIKSDVSRIAAALNNYAADNNGNFPLTGSEIQQFEDGYLEDDFVHPVSEKRYTISQLNSEGHYVTYTTGVCKSDNTIGPSEGSKQYVLRAELENETFHCLEV